MENQKQVSRQIENAEVSRKGYGKYDVEMAKIARDMDRSANVRANIKTVLKYFTQMVLYVCIAICVYCTSARLPETLSQLAAVIREYRLLPTLQMLVIFFLVIIIIIKNSRIKRLTVLAGDARHQLECNDVSNERSGLRPDGTAAEDERED